MYSIDTSSILDGRTRLYRPKAFGVLWEKVDDLIDRGIILCSEEVLRELSKKDDEVCEWLKRHKEKLVATDIDVLTSAQEIIHAHPRLVKAGGRRSAADPFVIGVARINSATVVSAERSAASLLNPKIPDVCQDLDVPCMQLMDLIEAENWTFR